MGLDLWIYGPGYGETIIMAWDDATVEGGKSAAVIDHYGGAAAAHSPALRQWNALGKPPLAFAAATHPHFDHIRNYHKVLEAAGEGLQHIFWWGGFTIDYTKRRHEAIARRSPVHGRDLVGAARMAERFLGFARTCSGQDGSLGTAKLLSPMGSSTERHACGGLIIRALSPWEAPQQGYLDAFKNQFETVNGRTVIKPDRVQSNRTSLGLLIEYGSAQILLGGDMEDENWRAWRAETGDVIRPCVVKVSHHGSSTGTIAGMWEKRGFFGSHEGVTDRAAMPVCVVTPWRRGERSRQLPDRDVLEQIKNSGCRLVVTGTPSDRRGLEPGNRYCDSHVHLQVQPDGTTTVAAAHLCET